MQMSHGAKCIQGCLDSAIDHPGSIVRVSSIIDDPTQSTRGDQLVMILRSPDECSGGPSMHQKLYHCVPITRTPLISLGTAHNVRHVHVHEVAYIEANGPFDLLIVQDLPKSILMPGCHLNFDYRDCVQPASVQRIPWRCLHRLPGDVSLSMVESSLEAVLRRVDAIACAMGDPTQSGTLPEGLGDHKRQEDIITLNLLRISDRIKQHVVVVPQPSGMDSKKSRKTSIWEQGTVPRNGGRG